MRTDPAAPIRDVLEEHLAEAAFLWTQREHALASPRYTVAEVAAGPERRLHAHLAGLAVGGAAVEDELLAPALGDPDRAVVAVAAAALARRGRVDLVRAAPKPGDGRLARAVARAVDEALPAGAERALLAWLDAEDEAAAVALEVLAARAALPPPALERALRSPVAALRVAALAAAPALGDAARPELERAWAAPAAEVHDAAVEAGLALGLRGAWQAAQRRADAGEATALDLLVLAASADPGDLHRLHLGAATPERRAAALFAAGFAGHPVAADLCVSHLADARAGRVAGEAFQAITGLAIAGIHLAPDGDDGDDPPVGPEADLPVPDLATIASWWRRERPRFTDGQRYVGGLPYTPDALLRALAGGPARRRGPVARELAVRSRGQWRLDTSGPAGEQLRRTAALRLVARADFAAPFDRLLRP